MQLTLFKVCTKCGKEKPKSEFHKRNSRRIGVQAICRVCALEKQKRYYIANKEKRCAKSREYHKSHKEERKVYSNNYQKENREYLRALNSAYNKSHPHRDRETILKRKFGLSLSDYATMLAAQNGVCAICDKPQNGRALFVDHDHTTGKVRGLLCHRCNTGIGMFLERLDLIEKATEYLRASSS